MAGDDRALELVDRRVERPQLRKSSCFPAETRLLPLSDYAMGQSNSPAWLFDN